MHLLRSLAELKRFKHPVSIALGVFDGVHLGHRAVILEAVRNAREVDGEAVILTFHPHPAKILREKNAPLLLTTEQQDFELFSTFDVDACVILDFTEELSRCPPHDFLKQLHQSVDKLHALVVGPNWHFGHKREGNFELLKTWADKNSCKAIEVPPVKVEGETISSTMIRKMLSEGNVATANARLGRPYQLVGRVVRGDGLGSKLGFPTANLDVENELIPAPGVYAARVLIESRVFAAAVNVGSRPTVTKSSETRVEAHLLDFRDNIYGYHMRLDFLNRVREERGFDNLHDLRTQIAMDIQIIRHLAHL